MLVALDNPFTDPVAEGFLQGKAPPPAGTPAGLPFAIHHHNLTQAGIHNIQNANLGAIAHDKVWLSCTIILPLRTQGAAGSPVRPVAIGAPAPPASAHMRGRSCATASRSATICRLQPSPSSLSCPAQSRGRAAAIDAASDRPGLLCVALVAASCCRSGRMIFPFVEPVVSGLEFGTIQAVPSATIGFGLHAAIFG